ncbi:MAG: phosphoglucosamine mutase [Alphaproteobacteria bacterium]|nr:phosphoglucosamine mutase [Alphaproteobacteria bacterium]
MSNRKIFGTDGIRGTANQEPMTAEIAMKVGMAVGKLFTNGDHRHTVVIGKDTRLSGYLIEPALTAGFISVGMDVVLLGPVPTPAVAALTHRMRADLGVMISASHNSFEDNGIKIFGPDGYKLSDDIEAKIEELICGDINSALTDTTKLGRAIRLDDAQGRYIEYAKYSLPKGMRLDGLKIVIDCANGAAYRVAPTVLWELGAEIIKIGVNPDGTNINKGCGAVDVDFMREEVVKHGADIGIALDGDADRVIISDEKGNIVDGDQILALIADILEDRGKLKGDGVVSTVMSNMGLEKYLEGKGMHLVRAQVGDRYVVEQMKLGGYNLGGEQSGHIILRDHTTTGDGLAAALQVCAKVVSSGKKTSEVTHLFKPFPQILRNIKLENKSQANAILENEELKNVIADAEEKLENNGRILIRKSGTEPLIRVMTEGQDEKLIKSVTNDIVKTIKEIRG